MSCQQYDPCVCAKISGIATRQTFQVATRKHTAEDCFAIKMNDFGERDHRLFAAVLS